MRKLVLVLALLAGGCAVIAEPDEVTVLRAAPVFQSAASAGGPIAVASVQADGAAADRRYAYVERSAPGVVRQARTLFWEDSPPQMLQRALIGGLSARAAPTVGPGAPVEAARRVNARLERFEEVTGGGAAQAVVAFQALVSEDRAVVLDGRYCGQAPIAGDAADARAQAFSTALAQAVTAFADDVRAGTASRDC